MNHIVICHILLAVTALCLAPSCRSFSPAELPLTPLTLDSTHANVVLVDSTSTNTVSVQDAILHALRTDTEINALAARCHRAAGDLSGIHPESPEIRVGYENGHDTQSGWSSGYERGRRTQTGSQRSTSHGTQTTEREQTSHTDYGDPWDPNQTSTENSTTRETSQSAERETSRSQSSSTKTSSESDYQRRQEDGLSVELRIRPPNPWQLTAERQAAKSVQTIAEAELLTREQELACDIVEACVRLLYHQKMLRIQTAFCARTSRVHKQLQDAFEAGQLPASDYADICRIAANVAAKQHRTETTLADLQRDLRQLTGVEPSRIELDLLGKAAITPFPVPDGPAGDAALASSLKNSHSIVLASRWSLHRSEAEWRNVRAANIPWITHLAAGFAWWDGSESGYGISTSSASETQTTQSSAGETDVQTSNTHSTESETPSGDVTERRESARQSSSTDTDSRETQYETSSSTGNESSYTENDGEEWWVEAGVEIPIFEWLSGESGIRAQAATAARQSCERVTNRIQADILTALRAARQNRAVLHQSRLRLKRELPALKTLAATARGQGLSGALQALRIEEGIIEMAILLLDCAQREKLARVDVVRSSGLSPSLNIPPPNASGLSGERSESACRG